MLVPTLRLAPFAPNPHYSTYIIKYLFPFTRSHAPRPDHPSVGHALSILGKILAGTGRHDEADAAYRRALEIGERFGGPDHQDVATALDKLSELRRDQGRYDEAERLGWRSLEI